MPNLAKLFYGEERIAYNKEPPSLEMHQKIVNYVSSEGEDSGQVSEGTCKYFQCSKMPLREHYVTPHKYHIGNSNVVYKSRDSKEEYGSIVEIAVDLEARVHFLLVKNYPIVDYLGWMSPYKGHPLLQAEVLQKEGGEMKIILGDSVITHFACLPCQPGQFGVENNKLLAVKLNHLVSNSFYSTQMAISKSLCRTHGVLCSICRCQYEKRTDKVMNTLGLQMLWAMSIFLFCAH